MTQKLRLDTPRKALAILLGLATALGPITTPGFAADTKKPAPAAKPPALQPTTPIQHLVVIFQENVSFDHYFGTYPFAKNPKGQSKFIGAANTPAVNGYTSALLTNNPNLNPANGAAASNPFRLDPSQAVTSDQDHGYTDEQIAFDMGLADLFPLHTGFGSNETMAYFDGNTVTALWNYAQFFAMSDNSYGTTFGPSTPGALNLIAGNTFPATLAPLRANGKPASAGGNIAGGAIMGAVIGDP